MSWDVMVFNFAEKKPSLEQLKAGTITPVPLGPAPAVRDAISGLLPGVDWSDPSWGCYAGNGFSIEFNAGKKDPIQSIMLHVRGGGDAIAAMLSFAVPNG